MYVQYYTKQELFLLLIQEKYNQVGKLKAQNSRMSNLNRPRSKKNMSFDNNKVFVLNILKIYAYIYTFSFVIMFG